MTMTRCSIGIALALVVGCNGGASSDAQSPAGSAAASDSLVGISPDAAGSKPRPFAVSAPADTTWSRATPSELGSLAASLIIPVQGVVASQLSDSYTAARTGHVHEALDIMAPRGTPVLSATDGRVLKLHQSVAGGNMVYAADASDRFILMYGHLDRYADGLTQGMAIKRGQFLGYVGTTGNAAPGSPHLHFAIARGRPSVAWWKGAAVNPYTLFVPSGTVAAIDSTLRIPVADAPTTTVPAQVAVIPTPAPKPAPVTAARIDTATVATVATHYTLTSGEAKKLISGKAKSVLAALRAHDMVAVSAFVDPTKGLRFSPYAHVDNKTDRLIKKDRVKSLWNTKVVSVWGTHDGSGAPLRLTYPEYHKAFVNDVNFSKAPKVAYNAAPLGTGNTPNNIAELYPDAIVVEYHVPGVDPKLDGMDWKSLWLVFEKKGTTWYLVGLVHGAWTI